MLDEATAQTLRAMVAKGAMPPLVLAVKDCRAAYDRLRVKGVEFTQEPVDRYGNVDAFALDLVASQGAGRALLEGIVVEALNVKTALFFLAFLPQFVAPGASLVPQLMLLGSICVALNTLVDVIAVFGADRLLKSGPARAARARLLTRASGFTMLGLGAWLALARREV